MRKQRTFVHFLKNGRISAKRPKGCINPSKGSKITVKGQADARIRICHTESKTSKKTTKRTSKGKGSHKGHRTKRGLAQDQRLKSQEPHEKKYRSDKRKGKR